MKLKDIPEFQDKSNVLTAPPGTPLQEAVDLMVKKRCGSILITQGTILKGIFTERDLLNKVVGKKADIAALTVDDVMTKDIKTAHADDIVSDCMRRMSQGRFRHLPIVDGEGNLVGLLSQGDFVAFTWADVWGRLSRTTRTSFASDTQIWMLLLGPLVYIVFVKLLFGN